ncbi:hypothetical protein [Halococcus sediminicola]|uniref:hypothetical protein n=1 Tax=Halococcus sediminicola TaxID=1264579 RepID=UPI000679D5C3|nr:hypothetical protein [Halococcus sediminicola]
MAKRETPSEGIGAEIPEPPERDEPLNEADFEEAERPEKAGDVLDFGDGDVLMAKDFVPRFFRSDPLYMQLEAINALFEQKEFEGVLYYDTFDGPSLIDADTEFPEDWCAALWFEDGMEDVDESSELVGEDWELDELHTLPHVDLFALGFTEEGMREAGELLMEFENFTLKILVPHRESTVADRPEEKQLSSQDNMDEVLERFPEKQEQLDFEVEFWTDLLSSGQFNKELRALNTILRWEDRKMEAHVRGDFVRSDMLEGVEPDFVVLDFDVKGEDPQEVFDRRPFSRFEIGSGVLYQIPEFHRVELDAGDSSERSEPLEEVEIDVGLSHLDLFYPVVDQFLEREERGLGTRE